MPSPNNEQERQQAIKALREIIQRGELKMPDFQEEFFQIADRKVKLYLPRNMGKSALMENFHMYQAGVQVAEILELERLYQLKGK